MDSLNDILARRDFDEPAEITSLKKYVLDNFQTQVSVTIRGEQLIITVPSAALAGTLRLQTPEIRRRCQLQKQRLIFRIG